MTTKNLVPRATGEGSLGTSAKKWGSIYADNIVLQDGETLATKISSQNSRITTAEGTVTSMEGTVTTLSGDVTSLYSSVDELSSGKVSYDDVLTLEEIEASTELADTDVASASALKSFKGRFIEVNFTTPTDSGRAIRLSQFGITDLTKAMLISMYVKYDNNEYEFVHQSMGYSLRDVSNPVIYIHYFASAGAYGGKPAKAIIYYHD